MDTFKDITDMAGLRALITGGNSGLGKAIAEAFMDFGVDVAICSRSKRNVEDLEKRALENDVRFVQMQCDINNEEDVLSMVDSLDKTFGAITLLINSAGINIKHPANTYPIEDFEQVMSTNVTASFIVSKALANKWMIPGRQGRIVNLSSAKAFLAAEEDYIGYCASKGAITMLTKQLACEWAKYGINVNAIAPTFVKTPINEKDLEDPVFYNHLVNRIPMRRIGTGKDIAAATLFLCSKGASFITGVTLNVDGGITSRQ